MDDDDMIGFLRRLLTREATAEVADHVVREIRRAFGGGSVYINAPPNDRRAEGIRMLRSGMRTDEVARALRVNPSTVYRWANNMRTRSKHGPGLGRGDWTL